MQSYSDEAGGSSELNWLNASFQSSVSGRKVSCQKVFSRTGSEKELCELISSTVVSTSHLTTGELGKAVHRSTKKNSWPQLKSCTGCSFSVQTPLSTCINIVLACAQDRPPKTSLKVYKIQEPPVLQGKKVNSSEGSIQFKIMSSIQRVKKQPLVSLRSNFCSSASEKLFSGYSLALRQSSVSD